jgi:hypothetical protein
MKTTLFNAATAFLVGASILGPAAGPASAHAVVGDAAALADLRGSLMSIRDSSKTPQARRLPGTAGKLQASDEDSERRGFGRITLDAGAAKAGKLPKVGEEPCCGPDWPSKSPAISGAKR